jgi:hypothetical protein
VEQLSKYVSAQTNSRNNRRAVFYVWSVPRGHKRGKEDRLSQFEFRDASLPGYELGSRGIEASELLSAVQLRTARSGACNSLRLLLVPVLKSVARKRILETNRLRTLVSAAVNC